MNQDKQRDVTLSLRPDMGGRIGPVQVNQEIAQFPGRNPLRNINLSHWTEAGLVGESRWVPEEVPVSLRINCIDYAVMLVSPADLEDFVYGFLYTEQRIKSLKDVKELSLMERTEGIVANVTLCSSSVTHKPNIGGHRTLAGATGCGLCGVQALQDAIRPVSRVKPAPELFYPRSVIRAVAALRDWQPFNEQAGALHVAACARMDGEIVIAREDVGRHNALDKLIGSMLRAGNLAQDCFVVMSSRCSYELVQKAATYGIGMLCTVSAPTSLAIQLAAKAGITLVSIARPGSFRVLVGEERFDWR